MYFDQNYLAECRKALDAEKAQSLAQTNNWAHVDRDKIHAEWQALYAEMAQHLTDHADPASEEFQGFVARHYTIIKEFYVPSKQAYIGMSLFYVEDDGFRKYHESFHPLLPLLLQKGMQHFAQNGMAIG
jgi:hypothetical protein